jgi:hypothetical protein
MWECFSCGWEIRLTFLGILYPGKAGITHRISNERAAEKCKIKNEKLRWRTTLNLEAISKLSLHLASTLCALSFILASLREKAVSRKGAKVKT